VTTSLLGCGGTAERRSAHDPSISHEADALEWVIRRASGGSVHLVGHSFGGLVALAVALRNGVRLASLVIIEAPAVELLRESGVQQHYRAFRRMTEAYFAAYESGKAEAIAAMIDFYGGAGTFASWPPRVRAYAIQTTVVNILDWASAYGFPPSAAALATIEIPTLVLRGGASHPAMQRASGLLFECMNRAVLTTVDGAAHFMIATHASEVGRLIGEHVDGVESGAPLTISISVIATDPRRLWLQGKRSGHFSARAPAGNFSFAQSPTIRARAIFPICVKITAALVKEAYRHAPMKIHKAKVFVIRRRYAVIRTARHDPPSACRRTDKDNRLRGASWQNRYAG
jgi:pimeloyl-ACP methyl ester carboxylesterase